MSDNNRPDEKLRAAVAEADAGMKHWTERARLEGQIHSLQADLARAEATIEAARHLTLTATPAGMLDSYYALEVIRKARRILAAYPTTNALNEAQIECPHWAPGQITMRKGCTACASNTKEAGK